LALYLQFRALVYSISRKNYNGADLLEKDFEQVVELGADDLSPSLFVFFYSQTLMAQ
jgi:hypothetical protein